MSTTIDTPDETTTCAYCGCAIFDHDPICVRDCTAGCDDPAYFCNYGCLAAHIDAEGLATGTSCEWSPE
jgi:hypothetical protein